ncbi:MAG TPA: hypothetical protein VFK30_00335 [Anaerolineae bacterium]|nr:hypothetical protein [Anaerolineae bacterium]
MATAVAYVGNTNNLELTGLQSEAESEYLNNVAVTVTVKTAAGVEVTGENWPVTMEYVAASNGDYVCGLSYQCNFTNGGKYVAFIDVDASDTDTERFGHWEFPFTAQTRKK